MTLRIACSTEEERVAVSKLLEHAAGDPTKRWRLAAPDSANSDLDAQAHWILSRLTSDLGIWRQITSKYKVDLFCGLFLERPNRGISLSPQTMRQLADRGIEIGFDIYAPD
jgi:ribosomal protein L19